MPIIIAYAQQKGGVAKSTTAANMGVELTIRGKSVAIVDLDHQQGTIMKWRGRREETWPMVVKGEAASLSETLSGLADMDFILLDLPGRRGPEMLAGMRAADFVIIPARPLDVDIEASGPTVAAAQRLGKRYAYAMVVVPPDGRRAREYIQNIIKRGLPVLPAIITARLAYPDAITEGLGVAEYEPNGQAAAEMSAFTTAVMRELK
jgi:chromosome partitioning protein